MGETWWRVPSRAGRRGPTPVRRGAAGRDRPGQLGLRRAGWTFASVSGRSPRSVVIASRNIGSPGSPRESRYASRSSTSFSFSGFEQLLGHQRDRRGLHLVDVVLWHLHDLGRVFRVDQTVRTSLGLADDAAGVDLAVGGRDDRGAVLVGDDLARLDDGLGQVLEAEAAGGLGEVGPVAPPSPSKRWQTTQRAAANVFLPFLKLRPFIRLVESATSSVERPVAAGAFRLGQFLRPGRACGGRRASMARRSASVALSKASLSMLLRKPWKLAPPLQLPGLVEPAGSRTVRSSSVQPSRSVAQDEGVVQLLQVRAGWPASSRSCRRSRGCGRAAR